MILTKKGSTRANLQSLFAATLVLIAARVLVTAFESTIPDANYGGIAWNKPVDITKDADQGSKGVDEAGTREQAERKKLKRLSLTSVFPGNKDNRPILFFMTDSNSPMCKSMEHSSLFNPAVRQIVENDYYPVKLALNEPLNKTEYQIYSQFATPGVPALVIATTSGETISSKTGFYSAVRAYVLLRQTANKIYEDDKKAKEAKPAKDSTPKKPEAAKPPTEKATR